MKTAFCLGNGESRRNFDLTPYRDIGPVYGCNAVYREKIADNVIAGNRKIVDEMVSRNEHTRCNFFTRPQWKRYYKGIKEIQYLPNLPFGTGAKDKAMSWSTGPLALFLTATQESDIVIMLGFDLYGTAGLVNNLFKGLDHYPSAESLATPYDDWVYQCSKVFEHFPKTQFVQIQPESWAPPKEWLRFENVLYDTFHSLRLLLSTTSELPRS